MNNPQKVTDDSMRDDKTLLSTLALWFKWNGDQDSEDIYLGLCQSLESMYKDDMLSYNEFERVRAILIINKPTLICHSEFYTKRYDNFWWPLNEEGFTRRNEFVLHLINKYNTKGNEQQRTSETLQGDTSPNSKG